MITSAFSAVAVEPFPEIKPQDDLGGTIAAVLSEQGIELRQGDVLVVASKIVSISEDRYVDLASITPSDEALRLSGLTGKPAELVQLILDESVEHFVAGERGPIIARHRLGYLLTSAGVDRAGAEGAWLLPSDPDASARALRTAIHAATNADVAVVIADSDGREDRRGSTVISVGAAGISPLRVTESIEADGRLKHQEETLTDMVAAAAGLILGQRGRGVPVVVISGISYKASDDGVRSALHHGIPPVHGS
ncbi:coenzyme F420-0:L-glutamate ligase [Streptomyces jumonjinensis]|uniref:coenzyme F420-0:L-glutamate ligase n=1 Tax=Streptomyces jumonjinensis TaxID=1945 RepID=UPI002B20F8E0|nr:coenzyme F420-0:L-glutamate ligase [Streptomyces jumonjinensis]